MKTSKPMGTSILFKYAGRYGRMFTNNGNKVEIALGYATLYGDVGGVVAPIGDLTKAEVFDMARFLNETVFKKEVIFICVVSICAMQYRYWSCVSSK